MTATTLQATSRFYGEHPAMRGRAGRVGVLEDVHGAIQARSFAIPHRKYALLGGAGKQIHLL